MSPIRAPVGVNLTTFALTLVLLRQTHMEAGAVWSIEHTFCTFHVQGAFGLLRLADILSDLSI